MAAIFPWWQVTETYTDTKSRYTYVACLSGGDWSPREVNPESLAKRSEAFLTLIRWCENNCEGRFHPKGRRQISFELAEDFVLFQFRFQGPKKK